MAFKRAPDGIIVSLGRQYNTATVILYAYINRNAGTPDKNQTKTLMYHNRDSALSHDLQVGYSIYGHHIQQYSKGKDQPDKVTNPARGQLNRENCPRSRLRN